MTESRKWEHSPGSDEAVKRGCKCPLMDNGYGRGAGGVFVIAGGCPVHDPGEKR